MYSKSMTWTQVNPDKFSQYDGLTPVEIGVALVDAERPSTLEMLRHQDEFFSQFHGAEPWNFPVDNPDWNAFWKDVYALRSKPKSDWDKSDFYAYQALFYLITFTL